MSTAGFFTPAAVDRACKGMADFMARDGRADNWDGTDEATRNEARAAVAAGLDELTAEDLGAALLSRSKGGARG